MLPETWSWILIGVAASAAIVVLLWRPMRMAAREARFAKARKDFHRQREWLEAKFIRLATAHSTPDSPHWSDCDFDDGVFYVRNRATGELCAFVAVTVALDGVGHSSGSATDLMGRLRAGTAVFRHSKERWETDGRVIPDRSPSEAIRFYQKDLEIVGQESSER